MAEPVKLAVDDFLAAHISDVLKLEGFFPEFRTDHLQKVFPRSGLYDYATDSEIIRQGDAGADVFIVYTGAVKILKEFGSAIAEVARLGPGAILGEMALLTDGIRTASAVAAEESQIYRLVSGDIQYILANNHELATHLKRLVAERLGK